MDSFVISFSFSSSCLLSLSISSFHFFLLRGNTESPASPGTGRYIKQLKMMVSVDKFFEFILEASLVFVFL